MAGAAAFEAIADAFRGTGLDVRVAYRGEGPALGHDAALFATRFIQAGLTNVLRHATASRVDIEVNQSPSRCASPSAMTGPAQPLPRRDSAAGRCGNGQKLSVAR